MARPPTGWPDRENPPPPVQAGEPESQNHSGVRAAHRPCPQCDGFIAAGKTSCVFCGFRESCVAYALCFEDRVVCRIGRDEEIDLGRGVGPLTALLLPRMNVSRNHCTLRATEYLQVRDNGSTNHTFVNGAKVGDGWVDVPVGATLRLASDVNFQVTGDPGD
jgi:hypothetical protein